MYYMENILYLPVSLGEAIDKLTILDIKIEKIKDNRKMDVKIEYDFLFEKLKCFVESYNLYYKIMKQINIDIWDMMEKLRDGDLSDNDYLIKCKECIEANDVRFRIKNKINNVSKSLLKEQKGYNTTRIVVDIRDTTAFNMIELYKIIRYISFMYDKVFVLYEDEKIMMFHDKFKDDLSISFGLEIDNNFLNPKTKVILFANKEKLNVYNELNIDNKIINNYFVHFE